MVTEKMTKKAKNSKKAEVKVKKEAKKEAEGGMSLDDVFGDDEDVEYAPSKPRKEKKKQGMSEEEIESELDEIETENGLNSNEPRASVTIKVSKPVSTLKKGDRIRIDGKEYLVDALTVLIDHGTTKEMAVELYDECDRDYQLRYFDDQFDTTLELYELQEILYVKKPMKAIEW